MFKNPTGLPSTERSQASASYAAVLLAWCLLGMAAAPSRAQTAFVDFNTPGQYTNNFNGWNDAGGGNGGNYAFQENLTNGVGGGGGVSVLQSTDTTATYNVASWDFSTNGAAMTVSVLIKANALSSGDKVQLGFINSTTNGLNGNAGVVFESFRFIPSGAGVWPLYEQYRSLAGSANNQLGTVTVVPGRWYKFAVSLTNTAGAAGSYTAGCALYDRGTDGLTPGTNLITFSTVQSHTSQTDVTSGALWPALRAFQDGGIDAWDNFLVYTPSSKPVFTLPLTNAVATAGNPLTFSALADGPGPITYGWYTNGTLVNGAQGSTYTTPPLNNGYNSVSVLAANANGSTTSSSLLTVGGVGVTNMTPVPVTGFNRDVVIENTASGPPYTLAANEFNPGEGTAFYQSGLPGTTYGLPVSGSFTSALGDGTVFQFQSYTGSNALVLSSETGISSGTLSLVSPAVYSRIAIIANSGAATATSVGTLTLNFSDGSSFVTNFDAFDWFFNPGFALQGVDRINLTSGAADGGPADPRFYQTTIDLAAIFGSANTKPLASLTFGQGSGANSTGIYGVSGLLAGSVGLPSVANLPASAIQATSATLNGQVTSTGGESPQVTFYYGSADGGTNPTAWAQSVSGGIQSGSFSQVVSGLTSGGTYYFTVKAQNSAGTAWAGPSLNFTTTVLRVATVTNLPATGVQATFATLNGTVLSTGGDTPTLLAYYGTTDGHTNAGSWANIISLGLQTGSFTQTISGLSSNQLYYFTYAASNSAGISWAVPSATFTTALTNVVIPSFAVLTYHNDNTRQGLNANETILTPANVNTNSFGRLFALSVDGFVYAQPLIMTNVSIPGKGTHNVVYVATEHNSVYAFDADNNVGANATNLWQTSFLGPGVTTVPNGDVGTGDIIPEVGITSTPVIDPATGTIYLEVKTKEGTAYVHRLHALDISTGLERTNFNSPVVINCTNYPGTGTGDNDGQNPPHVLWNPLREHSRPALTLLNGLVYMSFASHGDNQPYHGWMFSYNATNVSQQVGVYNATPNGGLGGFWDGGGGPSVDPQGNLYFQTGNGTFDGGANVTTTNNYAMSVLKLSTTNGINLVDYFAPANAVALSGGDQDLGSSAPIILPDSAGSVAHPHLLVGGGKTSAIYVMDRDNMGRFNGTAGPNKIVQQFNGSYGGDRDTTPAFFNNTLYLFDSNGRIGAYSITNATFNTTPVETPDTFNNKGGATVSISANGTSNAVAWAIYNIGDPPTTPCILRAYNAANLAQELYSSDQIVSRDSAGAAVKFTTPTIANGKVYVGAQYNVTVYGLAAAFLNAPVISPNGGIFTNSVLVTITDSSSGVTIYYTVDGTVPTTNSILYTAPFTLTNSAAVQAFAIKPGAVNSGIASASFINSSSIGSGTGLLGNYWTTHTSASPYTGAPTLVRTDSTVNFNWGNGSPDPSISVDTFTVKWLGAVEPQFNEPYTFYTTTDDGVRLWVNGQLIIDHWVDQGSTEWSGTISLLGGQRYNLEMDYYENGGAAVATLSWSSPSTTKAIIPTSQLYPVTNPPPGVVLTAPTNGSSRTATASVTMSANAAAQYNAVQEVDFYANNAFVGAVSNLPYVLTITGLGQGSYNLVAVAKDPTGLAGTSAPVNITVTSGSGQPYGLTNRALVAPFLNMPTNSTGTLPALLSGTGAFSNTTNRTPASGLLPYAPNAPQWKDNAASSWLLAVPYRGGPVTLDQQIQFQPTNSWSFPAGTVFVKNFDLMVNETNAAMRRLETQVLVRDNNGVVYGVTYKWRPDNSDADLLASSLSEAIAITNATGIRTQTWTYPSPSDCLTCHATTPNYVLGVNTRQLNGNLSYPATGVTDNQLRSFNRVGLLDPAINETAINAYARLSAITNVSASLQERVRSYLDANCQACHQPGGTGPTWDARYDTPLAQQHITNYPALFSLGISDNACVVKSQDIWRSVLLARVNTTDQTIQMPDFRNLIDTNAVQIITDWINSLPGTPALAPPSISPPGGTFNGSVLVTLLHTNAQAALYFTLDGTLPTTNSFLFSAPFPLTNSATLSVNAFAPGYNSSIAVSGVFAVIPGVQFIGAGYLTNGVFGVQLVGPTGHSYVLQGSTDFLNWVPVNTNVPASSPFTLVDPSAGGFRYRFYRAVQLP